MVQETGIKAIPMEKKRQKSIWPSGPAFGLLCLLPHSHIVPSTHYSVPEGH